MWRKWVFWKIIAGKETGWIKYGDTIVIIVKSQTDYKTGLQIFDSGLKIYFKKVVYSLQPVWSRATRNRMWAMS